MAKRDAHKKPVTYEVPPELSALPVAHFEKQDFDDVIFAKGYDAYIEKALQCPCVLKANSDALPNCRNCGGTKYIFINKRQTKVVSMSMNKQTKFLNWSKTERGTVSITVRAEDKVAFMDRITNLNLVSTYAETLQMRIIDGRIVGFTIYPIIAPTEIFLYDTNDRPLRQLQLNTDFEIEDNRIILNYKKYHNIDVKETTVAIRYTHNPQYHVLDITRDAVANVGALHSCENPEINKQYAPMPVHFVARKAHYMLDDASARGESVLDNTYVPNNTLLMLTEAMPFSLDYWLSRVTAESINESLKKEGDAAKIALLKSLL